MEAVTVLMHQERRDETCPRVQVFVFDLLALDGADLRGRPLRERKALLGRVLGAPPENDRKVTLLAVPLPRSRGPAH